MSTDPKRPPVAGVKQSSKSTRSTKKIEDKPSDRTYRALMAAEKARQERSPRASLRSTDSYGSAEDNDGSQTTYLIFDKGYDKAGDIFDICASLMDDLAVQNSLDLPKRKLAAQEVTWTDFREFFVSRQQEMLQFSNDLCQCRSNYCTTGVPQLNKSQLASYARLLFKKVRDS